MSKPSSEDFARFAADVHEQPSTEATIEHILDFARVAISADHAGVMLVHDGETVETLVATDPIVTDVDALQMKLGQGPDLDVLRGRESLVVADIATDRRWPEWAKLVSAAGIRSLLSVHMSTSARSVGTLNLYARRAHAFDADDEAVAHLLAQHAAVALAVQMRHENLLHAVDARKQIGQAQGMLMERFGLTAAESFSVLRRCSVEHGMKLQAVAATLVETSSLPGESREGGRPRMRDDVG